MADITVKSIDNLSVLGAVTSGDKLVVQHNGQAYAADASLFRGADGTPGADGATGPAGANGVSPTIAVSKSGKVTTLTIADVNGTRTASINDGNDGEDGVGVPSGGTTGQILKKASGTDYDFEWANQQVVNGIPAGGSQGQALVKNSGTDYDAGWGNIAGGAVPAGGAAAQVLVKQSSTDYDTTWASVMTPPVPTSSDEGKVLTVNSSGLYVLMDAVAWFRTYVAPTVFDYDSGTNTLDIVTEEAE